MQNGIIHTDLTLLFHDYVVLAYLDSEVLAPQGDAHFDRRQGGARLVRLHGGPHGVLAGKRAQRESVRAHAARTGVRFRDGVP